MKDFVKYTLATLFGLFLAGTAFLILGILSIAGILATENTPPAIPSHSILRLTLNGELQEDVPEDPLSELFGSSYTELSLKNILTAIQKAKEHPDIEGIYIEAQDLFGVTPAMARSRSRRKNAVVTPQEIRLQGSTSSVSRSRLA